MCCRCSCKLHLLDERCEPTHTRRFLTEEEKIEKLKNYAEDLKKELAAVEERIK